MFHDRLSSRVDKLKETPKKLDVYFLANGFRAMCTIIEQEYDRLTDWQNEFKFDVDKLRYMSADIREESAIAQLQNVLSPDEIKEKINLS